MKEVLFFSQTKFVKLITIEFNIFRKEHLHESSSLAFNVSRFHLCPERRHLWTCRYRLIKVNTRDETLTWGSNSKGNYFYIGNNLYNFCRSLQHSRTFCVKTEISCYLCSWRDFSWKEEKKQSFGNTAPPITLRLGKHSFLARQRCFVLGPCTMQGIFKVRQRKTVPVAFAAFEDTVRLQLDPQMMVASFKKQKQSVQSFCSIQGLCCGPSSALSVYCCTDRITPGTESSPVGEDTAPPLFIAPSFVVQRCLWTFGLNLSLVQIRFHFALWGIFVKTNCLQPCALFAYHHCKSKRKDQKKRICSDRLQTKLHMKRYLEWAKKMILSCKPNRASILERIRSASVICWLSIPSHHWQIRCSWICRFRQYLDESEWDMGHWWTQFRSRDRWKGK